MTFFSPFLSLRLWAVRGFHTVAWVSTCPFSGSPVIKQTDSLLAELSSVTLMLGRRAGRRAIVTGPVSIMILTRVFTLICSTYDFFSSSSTISILPFTKLTFSFITLPARP